MIDVHAHFADEGYAFPFEWEKIRAAGVRKVILASDTLEHAAWHGEFAMAHEGCYFTVGIHPEFAQAASCPPPASGGGVGEGVRPLLLEPLKDLAGNPKCVAVGEIGLDYHYGQENKAAQRDLFIAQLHIAHECRLPVQIHSRDACADTLAILRDHAGLLAKGFLMHCYSYGAENLDAFLQLGAYFSFGGVLCFKNARRAVEAAAICPIDRLLTETDSPYLSPFRGEKNTPANIPVIAERLAGIRGMPLSDLAAAVDANASRLFGI